MNLSVSQEGLSTPKGKIVSFDDIHAILHSVDSGKPFRVQPTTNPIENDQRRLQLQIQDCADIMNDTTNTGNNNIKRISEYYDSCALVKQLQSLDLSDESVLDQILTNPRPAALSELSAAQKNESMIPLVTAKDGRIFSILAGRPAYSDWAGKYPIGFPRDSVRKLSDPTIAHEKITACQKDALKKILAAVCATEDASEFLKPAHVLHPDIFDSYMELIADPIDLGTMRHNLNHDKYETMAEFRRHVDLLEQNARRYNGKQNKSITDAAVKVKSDIYRRVDEFFAEPPCKGEILSQIRRLIEIVVADDVGSLSTADTDAEDSIGTDSDESQGASDGKAIRLEAGTKFTSRSDLVLPLGRLCVARNADADEFIVTPYIVLMSIECVQKPLWLAKDTCTPVGLPDDKKTLLNFGGKYNFAFGKLTAHIDDWKIRSSNAIQGCNGNKPPTLNWPDVVKLIRGKACRDEAAIFDVVGDPREAAAVIKKAWKKSEESSQEDETQNFVVEDDDSEDRDYGNLAATSHMERRRRKRRGGYEAQWRRFFLDDTSDESEPPSKRTRAMTRPTRKTLRASIMAGQDAVETMKDICR